MRDTSSRYNCLFNERPILTAISFTLEVLDLASTSGTLASISLSTRYPGNTTLESRVEPTKTQGNQSIGGRSFPGTCFNAIERFFLVPFENDIHRNRYYFPPFHYVQFCLSSTAKQIIVVCNVHCAFSTGTAKSLLSFILFLSTPY